MRFGLFTFLLLVAMCVPSIAFAQDAGIDKMEDPPVFCAHCGQILTEVKDPDKEILHGTQNVAVALQDELFISSLALTAWGVGFWNWFSTGFHFKKEYGFRQASSTGGADKMGHFFDSYILSDFFNWRLKKLGFSKNRSAIGAAIGAMSVMTFLEIGDGTSPYGFSWEDMLADFIGVVVSATLAMAPAVDDVLDFRIQYWPTKEYLSDGVLVADYSGMKFLMAIQLSGFKPIKRTPLRFIELQTGYYSRGFRTFDANRDHTTRAVYVGLGFDVYELLRPVLHPKLKLPIKTAFTYFQFPVTAIEAHAWKRRKITSK